MKNTDNISGIKINIEAVDITIDDSVRATLAKVMNRLSRVYDKIEWADVYFEDKKEKSTQRKQVSIRLGIPGKDPFASQYGDDFHALLTAVEDKLQKQLERR